MLTRKVVLLLSLSVLLVEGDFDTNDAGIQAMSTDKDSTSDEAPTESMNAISPDQPDEPQYYGAGPSDTTSSSSEIADAPAASQVTAPEPAAATAISVEEEDEDESSDSEEGGKKHFSSRSAKAQSPALPPQSPAHVIDSPAVPRQPIIPQPKALVRNRTSKRRSRTNRRQI
ncbi:cytochrome c1 isoform X1 [Epinephelus fuscoguttatus]|uniref:cytochrome c1 isoform X1 n=1 Tax=Epinephelus fuscoguttatus TaxID=293821 RepID=UPI0020D049D8|nr:cytochrome c1 isoform X1 [Epinephelus fuscoguttatus]